MRRRTKEGEKIDPGVLKKAQAYLACQARHETPNPELSQAFGQFFRSCDPLLHRFASKCGVLRADLDECAERSWEAIVANIAQFPGALSWIRLRSWLYSVVQSKARDLARWRTRHPTESLTSRVEAGLYSQDPDPAVTYEQRCRVEMARNALGQLREQVPPDEYQVFYMRAIEERSPTEVGQALGMIVAQVWKIYHRTKQRFRRILLSAHRAQDI